MTLYLMFVRLIRRIKTIGLSKSPTSNATDIAVTIISIQNISIFKVSSGNMIVILWGQLDVSTAPILAANVCICGVKNAIQLKLAIFNAAYTMLPAGVRYSVYFHSLLCLIIPLASSILKIVPIRQGYNNVLLVLKPFQWNFPCPGG